MEKYDDILKEKQTNTQKIQPSKKKSKLKKYFLIDITLIIILLLICYQVYYSTILSPKNIIQYNIYNLKEYKNTIEKILNIKTKNYASNGNITVNDHNYQYSIQKKDDYLNINLENNNKTLNYYFDSNTTYNKSNEFKKNQYIIEKDNNIISTILSIEKNYQNIINNIKTIKTFSFINFQPIVETNFSLNNEQIHLLFEKIIPEDEYNIIIKLKNNALTNQFIDGKIIIANKTKNKRKVITIKDKTITIKEDNQPTISLNLTTTKEEIMLKINKDNNIYSVLKITKQEDGYQCQYQIIDNFYSIFLTISKENNHTTTYQYELNNKTETNDKTNQLLIKNIEKNTINEQTTTISNTIELTNKEKEELNNLKKEFFLPISKFIDEHKHKIN